MELSREGVLFLLACIFFSQKGARKGTLQRPLGPEWSDDDMFVFAHTVEQTGVPVEAALAVYTAESNLNPAAVSRTNASGLAQMMPATLRDIGYSDSPADFRKLGVADQAPWVAKLLEYQIKIIGFTPTKALDLYTANISPAAAKSKATIIYDSRVPAQAANYAANAGLDTKGKGYIDRTDLANYLRSWVDSDTYRRALEQLRKVQHVS